MSVAQKIDNRSRYAGFLQAYDRVRMKDAPLWLHRIRGEAMNRFTALGMPVTRELSFPLKEDWIYTDLRQVANTYYHTEAQEIEISEDRLTPYEFGQDQWHRLVFVNGVYSPEHSRVLELPDGVVVSSLAEAMFNHPDRVQPYLAQYADCENTGMTALNTALFEDGLFVHVPRSRVVETPIHVHYVTTDLQEPFAAHPRVLVALEAGAYLKVIESYTGTDDNTYLNNTVTECVVAEDAQLEHYRINRESITSKHVSTTQFQLARNSHVSTFNLTMGGALSRNDTQARLEGERAVVRMNGLYLIKGNQHVDNHTTMDHVAPDCDSYEVYKGILHGRSRGVFNGKVHVRQDAQNTDAKQLNKNLMLSPDALIHTKPQLEIYADQVKCTHGATVGQLDEDQIFYLRTRGLSRESACNLLTYGFAADLIRRLRIDAVRNTLDALFEDTIRDELVGFQQLVSR